jgi:hypothetical protein
MARSLIDFCCEQRWCLFAGGFSCHVHPPGYNSNIQASAAQNWPLKLLEGYWHGLSVFQEKPQANPRIVCVNLQYDTLTAGWFIGTDVGRSQNVRGLIMRPAAEIRGS